MRTTSSAGKLNRNAAELEGENSGMAGSFAPDDETTTFESSSDI